MGKISYIERRKRNFSIKILKIEKRKRICLQNLINREEKEKFFLTILKFEKRKRIWFSNSWKSRKEREMKIQFSRPREKKMSHFSRHFSRDRDSCHRLIPISPICTKKFPKRHKRPQKCQWIAWSYNLHESMSMDLNFEVSEGTGSWTGALSVRNFSNFDNISGLPGREVT